MLTTDTYDTDKLAALKALGPRIHLAETIAVYWEDGVRYYGSAALQELPNFRNINRDGVPITVEPRLPGGADRFAEMVIAADVGDERVSLNFHDLDGELTERFGAWGQGAEGVKVEAFYYLPQIDWFVSHWWGFMRPPTEVDIATFRTSASSGFRSSQMSVPRRMFQRPCQNIYKNAVCGSTSPLTSCSKDEAACIVRNGDTKAHTGFTSQVINITIGQTHGPATQATSRGNETQLKRALRVIYGRRVVRDLDLLAMRQEANTGHPDQGYLAALFMVCEGRVRSMTACSIVNMLVGAEHLNVRLGSQRQPATAYAPNVSNFNRTAHFFGRVGPLNPGGYGAANVQGQCTIEGRDEVRIYTGEDTYTDDYTTNTAWCLLDLYRDARFGHGLDPSRFVMADWIELARWSDENVSYTDPGETIRAGIRNTFNADVQGRTAQAQFRDICLWHRFTMPFQHNGKLRIMPLRGLTEEELEAAPVFYDDGPARNILRQNGKPLLSWSRISDGDLPNQLVVTFEMTDAALNINNVERPLTFGDEAQQKRAGLAFGDETLRVVEQRYQAFGIINENEVIRKANMLLDLVEFDEGGLKNNFRVKFTCHFGAGFELYQSQVIRIESALIARASAGLQAGGFKYFRVLSKTRRSDLSFEVTAQAYPELYWADVETVTGPGGSSNYSYEAEAEANTLSGGATVEADPHCSGGAKVTGVGEEGILTFNGITAHDGLARVTIFYQSPAPRDFYIRANSGAAQLVHGLATGDQPRSAVVMLGLHAGTDNTITIFHPSAASIEPDRILVVPVDIEPGGGGCRPPFGAPTFTDGRIEVPIEPC